MCRFRSFVCALFAAAAASAAPTQITLLHVNDTHSHLDAWGVKDASGVTGTQGGLAKAAYLVAVEKAQDPEALFVHAGDFFHGDPLFNVFLGVPELLMLQQLGLDAMAVGNHEFQYTSEMLLGVLSAAWPAADGVALLSSNADLSAFPELTPWVKTPFVKEVHGIKVGIFGLTTPSDPLEQPFPVVLVDPVQSAAASVALLQGQGAQVIVCLAHLGLDPSRSLAAQVPGIDVIVQGHEHVALAQPEILARAGGGSTVLVSAGEFYQFVGRLRLVVDGSSITVADYTLLEANAATPAVPELQAVVDFLKPGVVARFGDLYGTQIAFAEKAIPATTDPRHSKGDTPMGNLVTDAYRALTGTQIAIEVNGFIDTGLPAGPIVGADVFRVNAYGLPDTDSAGLFVRPARLATFRISGAELVAGIEQGLALNEAFLQVSGMRFTYDSRLPPGQRVLLDSVHVGGHKLLPDLLYAVTANELVLFFLPPGIVPQDVAVREETAFGTVRDYVEALGVLEPRSQGRIRDVARRP